MNDVISIIIPIYNVEKYLNQCIESVLNQSYKDLEIILVDDGSEDLSGRICDEYLKIDKRVKVIHKKNGGLSSARNIGIESSKGGYLVFVDGDDYLSSNYVSSLYNTIKKKRADISICSYDLVVGNISRKKKFLWMKKLNILI